LNPNFTTGTINTRGQIFNIFCPWFLNAPLVPLIFGEKIHGLNLKHTKSFVGGKLEGSLCPTAFKRDNFILENLLMSQSLLTSFVVFL